MQTVKLNNGIEMPILGYGVFLVDPKECERCVTDAINTGYRMIDTAQAYYNEEGVGEAIKKSGIKREEFFLVTKVWITNSGEEKAYKSIDESLKKLKTDYVDLILIHQPFGDYYGTYRAMQRAYMEGKARAIGVSNFFPDRYIDLCNFVEIKPMINQMETHVFQQQKVLREYMQKFGTRLMSWSPMARGENNFFNNEILKSIGAKYGKTAAQTALRFLTQEDVIVIPKSTHKERMAENFNIFDFELSKEDMETLKNLDKGESLFVNHYDPKFAEYIINY
ncbi:TPA: aldo/keto reductase [Candidatus Galligastranaerophilus gallistercoris]|nr:aldo/keto reductase [Candidatus Galligastranaerophilus gallistercoris]